MRGKVGAAHFEMIIGFVFFMGFVVFLFVFLSPWNNSSLPSSAVEGLRASFIEETETTLSSVFVDATNVPGAGGHCFFIDLPENLFEYATTNDRSLVRKLGGSDIDSSLSGGNLNFAADANYFRIAISPEFSEETLSGCTPFPNYDLGSVVEIKVVSYSSLGLMRERYTNDYDNFKRHLKVADIFDFEIVFEGLPEMNMEYSSEISDVVDVLAKEYIVKVLKSNGDVSNERVSIRIW